MVCPRFTGEMGAEDELCTLPTIITDRSFRI